MCTFAHRMEEKLTDKTCKEQALYLLDNLRNRVSTPISRRAGTTIPKAEVAEWVDLLAAVYGHSTRIPRFIQDWLEECDDIHLTADYCEAANNEDSDFSKAIKQVQDWKDKKVTCGFLLRWNSQTLAMLPTGRKPGYFQYDIPKGCCEPGETHYETAKRELLEETSIDLDKVKHSPVRDFGVLPYNKEKDIHLFFTVLFDGLDDDGNVIEEPTIKCASTFINERGEEVPEMSGYKWSDTMEDFFPNIGKAYEIWDNYRFAK